MNASSELGITLHILTLYPDVRQVVFGRAGTPCNIIIALRVRGFPGVQFSPRYMAEIQDTVDDIKPMGVQIKVTQ